jgi:transcriptional regulator with PAS, ATPase and Fis domain
MIRFSDTIAGPPVSRAGGRARALERLEVMRAGLRWISELDRAGVEKILRQLHLLRDELLDANGAAVPMSHPKSNRSGSLGDRKRGLLERNFVFEGIFGENPGVLETLEIAEKAAKTDFPVLIGGESGTGKELLARVIHDNGPRSGMPFVSVNCGAITPTLLESELFGHLKGAFTGATRDRKGKFDAADGGTIFLDEIGELPAESQVKLLRVLETGEIQRVGADDPIRVDARIVAATNRKLHEMIQGGGFREDLFYRLSVLTMSLPPLRKRRDEIPLLMNFFLTEAAAATGREPVPLSYRLRMFLLAYKYPGNVRELRNLMLRLTCLADETADLRHLPEMIRPAEAKAGSEEEPTTLEGIRKAASDAAERQFLEEKLRETKGNVTALAKVLGMNRSYLQTVLKKLGIRRGQV